MDAVKKFFRLLKQTYDEWSEDDGPLMAAAVAYFAALSFFPLLLILISGFGYFLAFTHLGQNAEAELLRIIGEYTSSALQEQVATMLSRVERSAAVNGPIGVAALLVSVIMIFTQFERSFDRIWDIDEPKTAGMIPALKTALWDRARAFLLLLGLGLLIVLTFIAGLVLSTLQRYTEDLLPAGEWVWWVVQIGLSMALNTAAFTAIYTVLPKQSVHWREGLRGGLLAAITWEVGRQVLAAIVIGRKYSAYGVVGSFLAVMLWIYFAATVLFLGAEFVQVICRQCTPPERDR